MTKNTKSVEEYLSPEKKGMPVERVKEILNTPNISNEEAEHIRDSFRILSEIIFEHWLTERNKG